ncbi:Monovalent cation/H(+) antiporter subunit G [Candidatus Hepatincolaceae symbiont of Richtersius coronifer]
MIFNLIIDIISNLFIGFGLFFCVVAVIGIYRFPGIYAKQHAVSLIDSGGIFFIFLGLAIKSGFSLISIKTMLLAILVIAMSAPGCYAFMQILVRRNKLAKNGNYKKEAIINDE